MNLGRSTLAVIVAVAATSVLGLVREITIAQVFGATGETDAFFFAFTLVVRLPQFLLPAIAAAFIPVYLRVREKEDEGDFVDFAGTALTLVITSVVALSVLVLVTAPWLASTTGAGFDEMGQLQATVLVRMLSPAIALLGTVSILKAVLEAEGRFAVAQAHQGILSLGLIAAVALAGQLGIYSLTVGVLAANLLQVGWMLYWLRKGAVRLRVRWQPHNPQVARFLRLIRPGIAGAAVLWAIPVIDVAVASHIGEGAVSYLNYANRPVDLLSRIAIHSLASVGLPVLALTAVGAGRAAMAGRFERYVTVAVFLLVPTTVFLWISRTQLIALLFQRGEFSAEATVPTAEVFGWLSLGLVPMALAVVTSTAFNALEDTRSPAVWGAGANLATKLVMAPILADRFGVVGIAASTSLMYVASATLLLWRLASTGVQTAHRALFGSVARLGTCGVLAGLAANAAASKTSHPLLFVTVAAASVGLIYLGLVASLRLPEWQLVRGFVRSEVARLRPR